MVPLGLLHIFFSLNSFTRASSGVMVAHLMPTPLACSHTYRLANTISFRFRGFLLSSRKPQQVQRRNRKMLSSCTLAATDSSRTQGGGWRSDWDKGKEQHEQHAAQHSKGHGQGKRNWQKLSGRSCACLRAQHSHIAPHQLEANQRARFGYCCQVKPCYHMCLTTAVLCRVVCPVSMSQCWQSIISSPYKHELLLLPTGDC